MPSWTLNGPEVFGERRAPIAAHLGLGELGLGLGLGLGLDGPEVFSARLPYVRIYTCLASPDRIIRDGRVGQSEQELRQIFDEARRVAPSCIVLEEVETTPEASS